jgi:hypothetical protein
MQNLFIKAPHSRRFRINAPNTQAKSAAIYGMTIGDRPLQQTNPQHFME